MVNSIGSTWHIVNSKVVHSCTPPRRWQRPTRLLPTLPGHCPSHYSRHDDCASRQLHPHHHRRGDRQLLCHHGPPSATSPPPTPTPGSVPTTTAMTTATLTGYLLAIRALPWPPSSPPPVPMAPAAVNASVAAPTTKYFFIFYF